MTFVRLRRPMALISAAGLALSLGAVSSGASAADAASNLDIALRHAPSAAADAGTQSRSVDTDTDCFGDPDNDVVISSEDGQAGTPISQEEADISGHCVAYGPTISLSLDVDAPTDPFTDEAWQDATFVGWFVDTDGDAEGEYFIEASLTTDSARFVGTTTDITDDDNPVVVCDNQTAQATANGYSISGIDLGCFGDVDGPIGVAPAIFYDFDGQADDRVAFDTAPGGDSFHGPVDQDVAARDTDRLAGANRDATSAVLSAAQFPNGADVVYLARNGVPDEIYADAVAGGVLTDGPILLVPSCGPVDPAVQAEIERLDPDQLIALGGPVAICDDTVAAAAGDLQTSRVAGETRFDTAIAIANRQFPEGAASVYVARSDVFVDAAVGGTVTDGPILLVPRCGVIPQAVLDEIADQGPERVVAFGGEVAICNQTFIDAAVAAPGTVDSFRLAGPTRRDTAVAISQYVFPGFSTDDDPIDVYLAREDVLADALVGGILTGGPILLTPTCGELPPQVGAEISRLSPDEVVALGGPVAICDQLLDAAARQ